MGRTLMIKSGMLGRPKKNNNNNNKIKSKREVEFKKIDLNKICREA